MCVHCVCNERVCFGCGAFQAMVACSAITTSPHETVCRCVCCVYVWLYGDVLSQRLNRLKLTSKTPEYTQSQTYIHIFVMPRSRDYYGITLSCAY